MLACISWPALDHDGTRRTGAAGEALRALEQAGQPAAVIGEVVAGAGVEFR